MKKKLRSHQNARRRGGAGLVPYNFLTNTTPDFGHPSSAEEGTSLSSANSFTPSYDRAYITDDLNPSGEELMGSNQGQGLGFA